MSEYYYLKALEVLTAAEEMMKNLGVEYKGLVGKALAGIKRDMESSEELTQKLTALLNEASVVPDNIGALSEEERKKLEE